MYSFSNYRRAELRRAVKRAEPLIFDDLLRFLEDDPRTFGSGYLKQSIWKYIKRYPLTPDDITRLEQAALQYLRRPMSGEFKFMCQTMTHIATDRFWDAVQAELKSEVPRVRLNASCLYPYREGMAAGEKQRLEHKRAVRHTRYRFTEDFIDKDQLLKLVCDAENWPEGRLVYREPNPADLPIIYYDPSDDQEFAGLDIAASHKNKVLETLNNVLSAGTMHSFMQSTWLYAIYLLRQLDDAEAVPILIRFIEDKISYKFESPKKQMLESTSFKVLRYYATPEALAMIEKYSKADRQYTEYYRGRSYGWVLSYP